MRINLKAASGLILISLIVAAWAGLKTWRRPAEPLVTFASTTGGILLSSEGRISPSGSLAVIARAPVILRVYMIDKGEQTLKETIRFDPKDEPSIYFTLCVTSQEGPALVIRDHPTAEREQIYRAVKFPMPVSMGSGDCYGRVDPSGGAKRGEEHLAPLFILAWTEHGSPQVGSIADMKKQSESKDLRCSYFAVTCEKM